MTMAGCGPYQIAQTLEAEKVDIPAVHLAKNNAGLHQNKTFENPYHWVFVNGCKHSEKA